MNPRRTMAIARKEALHISRDPRSLLLAVLLPIILLLLFGYALSLDVENVPMVVWNQDGSTLSREFESRFSGSGFFLVRDHVTSYRELEHAVDAGEAKAALVIPPTFGRLLPTGQQVPVQLIVDASDGSTATVILNDAEGLAQGFSRSIAVQNAQRVGAMSGTLPFEPRPRVWYNPDLTSRNFIVPGLISMIMAIIAALMTSLTIAREWESGTMEQLIATPVRSTELVIGKLLPYFAVGLLDVAISVGMGRFLFGVPLHGSVWLLFGMASVFLVGTLAQGMLISAVTRSQLLASMVAMLGTFLPAFLLSGMVFSIRSMPLPIQLVTYIIPARYFLTLCRGIYLKGVGLDVLGRESLFLLAFSTLVLTATIKRMRKKLV
jgi:ABC-2 type transport system permease protein